MKRFLFATIATALLVTGCYKDDIWQLHSEVESLEGGTIAPLAQQADNVESSIANLNDLNEKIQQFIDQLEKSGISVGQNLGEAQKIIDSFKASSLENIDATKADFLSKIDDLNDAVNSEMDIIEAIAAGLDSDSGDIQKKIDALKEFIKNFAERDWVSGTYATLEKQNGMITDLALLKERIETLQEASSNLNAFITKNIDAAMEEFNETFSSDLADMASDITGEYAKAVSTMVGVLDATTMDALTNAVQKSQDDVMKWINSKLKDYLTIAEANAHIEALNDILGVVPDGSSLQDEIDNLQQDIISARSSIKSTYEGLLKETIEKHEGTFTAKIDSKIQDLRNDVIKPVTDRLEPLDKSIKDLWKDMGDLEAHIKKVEDQKDAINASLAILNTTEKTLQEYVEAVKKELVDADASNFSILKGLIDKLDALVNGKDKSSLPSQIKDLREYVGTLPDGETDIATWIKTTFSSFEEQKNTMAVLYEVNTLFNALKAQLGDQETGIANLERDLDNLMKDNETKIQGWIDAKLDAYYTIGDLKGELDGYKSEISEYFENKDEDLQGKIDAISNSLTAAEESLATGYAAAIEKAITEQKGIVDGRIETDFADVTAAVTNLQTNQTDLETEIIALRAELSGYMTDVTTLEGQLTDLASYLKAEGYETLKAVVDDLMDKLTTGLKEKYADYTEFETEYAYVKGDLATAAGKVQGLVDRLKTVTDKLDIIKDFVEGFDGSETSLYEQVETIKTSVDSLMTAVFGSEENPALQDQIDAIMVALYGEGKDPEKPSNESIVGTLKFLEAKITAKHISSITYIPRFSDQTEAYYPNGSDEIWAQFRFLVRPASLAPLVAENVELKYKSFSSSTLIPYKTQSIETDDDVITVFVKASKSSILDDSEENPNPKVCSALFFEIKDDQDRVLSSYTSKFIYFQSDDSEEYGTGNVPIEDVSILENGLILEADGSPVTITVGAEDMTLENRNVYWLVHALSPSSIIYAPLAIIINAANSEYINSASWLSVSPGPTPFTSYSQYPFVDYYEGKQTLTISATRNTTGEDRSTVLVFRKNVLSWAGLGQINNDLIITVTQKGE